MLGVELVVRFLPPLIVTAEQVDAIADRFADAVGAAGRQVAR
jgi:acetylornithine/succinyldiaminopimelate/putrescine aminotransferase